MIQLKTITKPHQFAALVKPESKASNDAQLITDIEHAGQATLFPYVGFSFTFAPPVTITPEEFSRTWQGD